MYYSRRKKKPTLKTNTSLIKESHWKFTSHKDCNFIFNVNFYLLLEVNFNWYKKYSFRDQSLKCILYSKVFILFEYIIWIVCSSQSEKKNRMEDHAATVAYVLKSCSFRRTENCTSFGLVNLFPNNLCTKISFQEILGHFTSFYFTLIASDILKWSTWCSLFA